LFENSDSSKVVIAFRGTQEFLDWYDDLRPFGFDEHYVAMLEFISAVGSYVSANGIKDVIVAAIALVLQWLKYS
jgi:hypothetical protein